MTIKVCSSCNKQPAHPCYGTRCEDCWANSMKQVFPHRAVTIALMVALNHRRYKTESTSVMGAYKHWQGRICHKGV